MSDRLPECIGSDMAPIKETTSSRHNSKITRALRGVAGVAMSLGCAVTMVNAFGETTEQIGPLKAEVALSFDIGDLSSGGTTADFGVAGGIDAPTHTGPVKLTIRPESPDTTDEEVQKFIREPRKLTQYLPTVADDIRPAVENAGKRAGLLFLGGAFAPVIIGATLNPERRSRLARGALIPLLASVGGVAYIGYETASSYNPNAASELRPTGLVKDVLTEIGDVRTIIHNYKDYVNQLGDKVDYYLKSRQGLEGLSANDRSLTPVLVVSDLHCNIGSYPILEKVVASIQPELVLDAGDSTDYGTDLENRCFQDIQKFKIKDGRYVVVGGNHDTKTTTDAYKSLDKATVLEGEVVDVAGFRIFGMASPVYSPEHNGSTADDIALNQAANDMARTLDAEEEPVDILLFHHPKTSKKVVRLESDKIGLSVSGHTHKRDLQVIKGVPVYTEGSTGAAGLRGFEHEEPTLMEFSIIYFNENKEAVAMDNVSVNLLQNGGMTITPVDLRGDS